MLAQWFFGFTGQEKNDLEPAKRLLLLCLLLIPAYTLCWVLFDLLRPLLNEVLGILAQLCFQVSGRAIEFLGEHDGVIIRSFSTPAFEADVGTRPIISNTPLLWALMAVTPGLLFRRRISRLALAGFILIVFQAIFLSVKVEVTLIEVAHPWAGYPEFWRSLDDLFEITGKAFLPIAIWFALTLPYLFGEVDRRRVSNEEKVGRNDPCPCGSGKKFKRCCANKQ